MCGARGWCLEPRAGVQSPNPQHFQSHAVTTCAQARVRGVLRLSPPSPSPAGEGWMQALSPDTAWEEGIMKVQGVWDWKRDPAFQTHLSCTKPPNPHRIF